MANRDELNTRPPAEPPRWHGDAIYPIDTLAHGTWIAATRRGLVLSVLNHNMEPAPELPAGLVSRGALIPSLADAASMDEVEQSLRALDASVYAPFRLVVVEPTGVLMGRWDRARMDFFRYKLPACFVSSGMGDSIASPRLSLFDEVVRRDPAPGAQDAYHRHAWPSDAMEHAGAASVLMRRPDARTHSITTCEVTPDGQGGWDVEMAYEPID
ncbi:MAG: NRDE family protein [Planctomycetota bacterium]